MTTIYELTEDLRQLYEMATDPEVDPEVLMDTIEGVEGEFELKADGYAKVMAQLNGDALSLDAEIKRLQKRKKVMENSSARIKESLENAMRLTNKTKFKTEFFTFSIQKNPPSLKIKEDVDLDLVPPEFLVFTDPAIDKAKVKNAIKAGQTFDWAEMTQTDGLRIR